MCDLQVANILQLAIIKKRTERKTLNIKLIKKPLNLRREQKRES